jgi:hypothetical protein
MTSPPGESFGFGIGSSVRRAVSSQSPLEGDETGEDDYDNSHEDNDSVNVSHASNISLSSAASRQGTIRHRAVIKEVRWPIMIGPEKLIAREVHALLLEARPQADDVNLARATEITSSPELIAMMTSG